MFSQKELNDFIRNMGLPKDVAEYCASTLKNRNLLQKETKVTFYRTREKKFKSFFSRNPDKSLVYCNNIKGLINELKPDTYSADQWRLFIDSSKRSLKAVLLHNTNKYAPIPVAHSTVMNESYENLKSLLAALKYDDHKWQVCGDFKILTIILGQQSGYTKKPCYLCKWDSRDKKNHYVKKVWEPRTSFVVGSDNILQHPLIDSKKVLIPPLHIKLGLMKQFVKALNKEGDCYKYLRDQFPGLSDAKIGAGVFDGPQIRKMFRDDHFVIQMSAIEKNAWVSFKKVCSNFLGNHKSPDYKKINI